MWRVKIKVQTEFVKLVLRELHLQVDNAIKENNSLVIVKD